MSEQGYEGRFASWLVKNIPDIFPVYYGSLEWSHFIEVDGKKIYFPDFGLHSKKSLKIICWVDIKGTQCIDKEGYDFWWNGEGHAENKGKKWYNLDINKHRNYQYVANVLDIPTYVIIYEEGKESRNFSYWARIDKIKPELKSAYILALGGYRRRTTRNFIPLEEGNETFKEEIVGLMSL
jgi:hypothetical protein